MEDEDLQAVKVCSLHFYLCYFGYQCYHKLEVCPSELESKLLQLWLSCFFNLVGANLREIYLLFQLLHRGLLHFEIYGFDGKTRNKWNVKGRNIIVTIS